MVRENTKIGITLLLLLSGLAIAGLFIVLFAELAKEVMSQEFGIFDSFIIKLILVNQSPTMDALMIFITELGSVWFLGTLSIVVILALWFKGRDKWGVLFFIIAVGGGGLLTTLLKHLYARERPSINEEIDAVGFSFPSGHSMGSLIFYGFVIFLIVRGRQKEWVKWTVSISLALLVILIGTSRIYLGAHFPSDVAAGYIAGTIWLLLCLTALEWIIWQSGSSIRPVKGLRKMLQSGLHLAKDKKNTLKKRQD
ncbi:phosphatase PAP2 family protein [Planomicrobium sp. Y74]|uniref:phosphatase PAP2 family protein n=1 Tax=Planomicrobium sp. Y74 TaxID=2478977 RepID=UPI000EF523ED|nr:phosphatase PAP2 family protein [Planomicrobium sp. Y74]RLQ91540.1 phosphatase PAP2 family protein [Planomicrobium sp. Y74]